jgi:hypothetical protein
LSRYFTLGCREAARARAAVGFLKNLSFVEDAYVQPRIEDPGGTVPAPLSAPLDPLFSHQGYLLPADGGIDALYARDHWPDPTDGGPGTGIGLVDVEMGWTIDHEDLPPGITLVGSIRDSSRHHGTGNLGILCAVPNTAGCIGIAPGLTRVGVVSHWNRSATEALADAIDMLLPGDVLLLEMQTFPTVIVNPSPSTGGAEERDDIPLPVEASSAERELIEDAVALGIVVVEAAGNGMLDLDTVFDLSNTPIFAQDSGAILVSAATSTVPHSRDSGSNYGTAVSCFAWGDAVTTCWSNSGGATDLYTDTYANTSAAAAIVAGAAVVVQSYALKHLNTVLSPADVRAALKKGGTKSANPLVDKIGVMPNLKEALAGLIVAPLAPTALTAPTGLRLAR